MIDVPVSFKLDQNGEVLQGLSADAPLVIMDMALNAVGQNWSKPLEICAELIVPSHDTLEDEFTHQAFFTAGIIACHAFGHSDAPEELISKTLRHMALARMPMSVLAGDSPLDGLQEVAQEGHARHREFKDHTDFIMEYYCATTQNPRIARVAFCGAGVALYQIENAWERARDLYIEAITQQVARDTNWDLLPWAGNE